MLKLSPELIVSETDLLKLKSLTAELQSVDIDKTQAFSSVFTSNSPDFFFWRQEIEASWTHLETLTRSLEPRTALLATPLFWQLAPWLYRVMRSLKVPVAVVDPRNHEIARLYGENVEVDLVVTTQQTALMLIDDFKARSIPNPNWLIISSLSETVLLPDSQVSIEYHLFPGRPIGYSNRELGEAFSNAFVPSDDFLFEVDSGGQCFVSSDTPQVLPLRRFLLPGRYEVVEDLNHGNLLKRL